MGATKVRISTWVSELFGAAAVVLLSMAMVYRADGTFALFGLVCVIACAAAGVSAVVMCAAGKVMQAIIRQTMAEQAAEYLRRNEL